jgi:hypothetical protein
MVAFGTKGVAVSVGIEVVVGTAEGIAVGGFGVAEGGAGISVATGRQLLRTKTSMTSTRETRDFCWRNFWGFILTSLANCRSDLLRWYWLYRGNY